MIRLKKESLFWIKIAMMIIVLSLLGVLILSCFSPFWHFNYQMNPSYWATLIGSAVAIANAILLYSTLNSQKEGLENEKKIHKQERFETTFFNLLQIQRKLTDELSIKSDYIDFNGKPTSHEVIGRQFFAFIINEMQLISNSLESNVIIKYDWEKIEQTISAFEATWEHDDPTHVLDEKRQQKWEELTGSIQIQYTNFVYDITTKDKDDFTADSNLPYKIFIRKWYPTFDHYIRNLYYILQYVYEENYSNKNSLLKYVNFIQSQMSRNELYVIVIHGKTFHRFQELLTKTHLTDIITCKEL